MPYVNEPVFCQVGMDFEGGGCGLLAARCHIDDVSLEWNENDELVVTLPEGSLYPHTTWPADSDTHVVQHHQIFKTVILRFNEAPR